MVASEQRQQPKQNQEEASIINRYVGTLVGESTSREFRLAVAHEEIREQDIIGVDAELRQPGNQSSTEKIRIWAKVQRIERLNPLFPSEAGHELAATRTNPFDTVLSLSREMVTAVCQVLGVEPLDGSGGGKLDQLRYPPQPASSAYRPDSSDIARVVVGELQERKNRALDVAWLANRREVDVNVDGHAIVSRHLAILAMTGAGKSWASRRVIEELAAKNYPIVIFDPHGDYTGLADLPELNGRVDRYYARLPIFEQSPETVITIIESLGWKLANTHISKFDDLFKSAFRFISGQDSGKSRRNLEWLSEYLGHSQLLEYRAEPNLYFFADFVQAVVKAARERAERQSEEAKRQRSARGKSKSVENQDGDDHLDQQEDALDKIIELSGYEDLQSIDKKTAGNLEGLPNNLRVAAKRIRQMEDISKRISKATSPLPNERSKLVQYGKISIVALSGYTSDFQATIYSLIASDIFSDRVQNNLKLPVLLVLEEAHNFIPGRANTNAEQNSIATTKQIAQEGRKFGVGLLLISQRPSRLDETTLAMCNSFVIMRMVNPADQNFVRKVIESLGEDEAKLLPDLDKGEAILSGQLINFPVLVKMKPPKSQGEREEKDAFVALEEAYRDNISTSDSRK
ncbi:ATP-binding protein [Nodosilinea sp. LEGE 07088]|uniref:ATP-binding protein n=1 Tax=Nodosilinea sp. LEGE 07088 TaxID=2777968 RepID=UPI0018809B76|nr:ATP-binding protein [Nodosilinea sp. LEGE 07088]MBE9135615.1 ATP-binding protein [Nodosilinea sp. LEGE 07088]